MPYDIIWTGESPREYTDLIGDTWSIQRNYAYLEENYDWIPLFRDDFDIVPFTPKFLGAFYELMVNLFDRAVDLEQVNGNYYDDIQRLPIGFGPRVIGNQPVWELITASLQVKPSDLTFDQLFPDLNIGDGSDKTVKVAKADKPSEGTFNTLDLLRSKPMRLTGYPIRDVKTGKADGLALFDERKAEWGIQHLWACEFDTYDNDTPPQLIPFIPHFINSVWARFMMGVWLGLTGFDTNHDRDAKPDRIPVIFQPTFFASTTKLETALYLRNEADREIARRGGFVGASLEGAALVMEAGS
jgi:hypothetical protein